MTSPPPESSDDLTLLPLTATPPPSPTADPADPDHDLDASGIIYPLSSLSPTATPRHPTLLASASTSSIRTALSADDANTFWRNLNLHFAHQWRKIPLSWSVERDPGVAFRHLLTLLSFVSLCIFVFSVPSLLYLISPRAPTPPGTAPALDEAASMISGKNGAVAADVPLCSELGVTLMKEQSANAVDAMVTVALCQGVLAPFASGLGGGAFILIHHQQTGISRFYDAREVAPMKAAMGMFRNATTAKFDGLAVAVPGELRGLYEAHRDWGRLRWRDVVTPAVRVAEEAEVGKYLAIKLRQMNETIFASPSLMAVFTKRVLTKKAESQQDAAASAELPGVRRLRERMSSALNASERGVADTLSGGAVVADANDKDEHGVKSHPGTEEKKKGKEEDATYTLELLEEGDRLVNKQLVKTLKAIAEHGADALYVNMSEAIAQEVRAAGGVMSREDVLKYRVERRDVVRTKYQGFKILGAGVPSSGGASIGMALNMITELQFRKKGRNSVTYQLLVESLKWVFGAAMGLGDPAYVSSATGQMFRMLTRREAMKRAYRISRDRTFSPGRYSSMVSGSVLEGGTSHVSIVDVNGSAVAMTSTINLPFGAGLISNSSGVILNDQMDSFTTNKTRLNAFGMYPTRENAVQGGKRAVSSMCPTIILRGGKTYLVIGGGGGPRAISGVLQTIINVLDFGDSMSDAISAPRVHHQLVPNVVSMEGANESTCEVTHALKRPSDGKGGSAAWSYWKSVCEELKRIGHKVEGPGVHGAVQAVLVPKGVGAEEEKGKKQDEATMFAVSDPRRIGKAAAY